MPECLLTESKDVPIGPRGPLGLGENRIVCRLGGSRKHSQTLAHEVTMSKFNKFKRREPNMSKDERAKWDAIQAKLLLLGFENASLNPVDIMFARDADQLLWELERFIKNPMTYKKKDTGSKPEYRTGLMNLDPIGMS